jgi:hypothetical protein
MIVELRLNGRLLIQVDIWYLVLSSILRGRTAPIKTGENWNDAILTVRHTRANEGTAGTEAIIVPQPPEFKEDSKIL